MMKMTRANDELDGREYAAFYLPVLDDNSIGKFDIV